MTKRQEEKVWHIVALTGADKKTGYIKWRSSTKKEFDKEHRRDQK